MALYYTIAVQDNNGGSKRYYYRQGAHNHDIAIDFGRAARMAYAHLYHLNIANITVQAGSYASSQGLGQRGGGAVLGNLGNWPLIPPAITGFI